MTWRWLSLFLGWAVCTQPAPANAEGTRPPPSLQTILQAALRHSGFHRASDPADPVPERWVQAARHRAWLPRVQARFGTDLDQSLRAVGDLREDRAFGGDVRILWDLRDGAFHPAEVAARRERRAWLRERMRVRVQVAQLYARYRAGLGRWARVPSESLRQGLCADAAQLSAWTGFALPCPEVPPEGGAP